MRSAGGGGLEAGSLGLVGREVSAPLGRSTRGTGLALSGHRRARILAVTLGPVKAILVRWVWAAGALAASDLRVDADEANRPRRMFGLGSLGVAAVSGDKRHLATAGESASYLWDFETGTVKHRLPDHLTAVTALCFSPDSTRLVTGARFGSVGIWSTETGTRLGMFEAHGTDVNAIVFSGDGTRFVTASADNTASVWSLETGELEQSVRVPGVSISKALFTPDGRQLVTADTAPTENLRLWDLESGRLVRILGEHAGGALALSFLTDGTLATGGVDQKVRLWNLATGESVRTLEAARGAVNHLVAIPGGNLLAAGSQDQRVNVYDGSTGNALHLWSTDPLSSLSWVPGTARLLTATTDLLVREVDMASGLTQRALSGHTTSVVSDVAFSPDGRHVLSGGVEKFARLWNRTNAAEIRTFEGSGAGTASAVFSPDGRHVLTTTGFPRKVARLWDAETGRLERDFVGHTDWLLAAVFSADGSRVATSSMDRTVRVWNTADGRLLRSMSGGGNFMYAVAFSPDGKRVAGGGSAFDPTVHVWDVESGSTQATISADAGSVRSIVFAASGSEVIVGWEEGLIRMLDLVSGKVTMEVFSAGFLGDLALSPDGELLAVAEGWPSFATRLFEVRSGRELRVLTGHAAPVTAVAFDASGTQILTGADVVRLWDVADLTARLRTKVRSGGLELSWSQGRLQQAATPDGPWSTLPEARSPHLVLFESPGSFFRVETEVGP